MPRRDKARAREYDRDFRARLKAGTWINRGGERHSTPRAMIHPTQRDLGWAAGFIEGEGSIAIYRGGSAQSCGINATNCDREPLLRLQQMFGGCIHKKSLGVKNRQQPYYWGVYGVRARGVIMTLYAMLSRRRQAKCRAALLAVAARTVGSL